jgi:hypothetical protein
MEVNIMDNAEMQQRVQSLRGEGRTFRDIAKELHISLGKAHKLWKVSKQSEETLPHLPQAHYSDAESRFLNVLTNYGVPPREAETALELIGSFGEQVFSDGEQLLKALRETSLSPSKRASVLRHWCRVQGLAIPLGIDPPVPSDRHNDGQRPERFFYDPGSRSILPDPEGPYSWSQAYQLRLSDQPRQSGGDDGMKRLEERLAGLERSLLEQREKSFVDEISRLRQEIATSKEGRSAVSDLDVMSRGIDHISKQLEGGRSDIKELLFFLLKQPPRPMSRAERDFVEGAISAELAKEGGQVSRLDELARQALGEEFRHPSHPEQGMAVGDARVPISYE